MVAGTREVMCREVNVCALGRVVGQQDACATTGADEKVGQLTIGTNQVLMQALI